jgi:hypothetical protein
LCGEEEVCILACWGRDLVEETGGGALPASFSIRSIGVGLEIHEGPSIRASGNVYFVLKP